MDSKTDDSDIMVPRNAHFSSRNPLDGVHQDEVRIRV
jgi:hypothetical protein